MSIRDMFPHNDDLIGAVDDIDALQAWQATAAYSAAPVQVRETVRNYLQRLQSDVAGIDWNEAPRVDVIAEIERAYMLRAWLASEDGQAVPVQITWAIDAALDAIGELLAETCSTDHRVLFAQAANLAQAFSGHPFREGTLSRSLLSGLAGAAS